MSHPDCIFCKIIDGQIPAKKVYEDEDVLAFHDIHPAAPVHFLVIPKRHIVSLQTVDTGDAPLLGRMMTLIPRLASEQGCRPGPEGGFRLIANNGKDGGQEVGHLHFHVLGGPRPWKI